MIRRHSHHSFNPNIGLHKVLTPAVVIRLWTGCMFQSPRRACESSENTDLPIGPLDLVVSIPRRA